MAVYVDPMFATVRTKRWPYQEACHLVADTVEQLHDFARRLALAPQWFNPTGTLPHYNLTRKKRSYAITIGAIEIDRRELGHRIRQAAAAKIERNKAPQ